MREKLEELIKQLLRVPPEPHAPLGAEGSLQLFRASPAFLRYRLLGWGIGQGSALIGIVVGLVAVRWFVPGLPDIFFALELLAIAFVFFQLPVSFLMILLDYEYRWYMVTDRSLRIREGVVKVQEKTMTFSNVQNVSIRQGPVQRLFGISDVEVRTAGGGDAAPGNQQEGMADNLHLGYFRGVDNAAEIRDAILGHLKRLRSAGLGDPDEPAASPVPGAVAEDGELLAAGREVLAEARALRQAVALPPSPPPRP